MLTQTILSLLVETYRTVCHGATLFQAMHA